MDDAQNNKPGQGKPFVNATEMHILFVSSLFTVHKLENHVVDYLPQIAQKASYQGLKFAIINTTSNIKAQLFKLEVITNMAKHQLQQHPAFVKYALDLKGFITKNIEGLPSYQTDFLLTCHLIALENLLVNYLQILTTLAKGLKLRKEHLLLKECLADSLAHQKTMMLLRANYIV